MLRGVLFMSVFAPSGGMASKATLFLRHGGQLTTEFPSMKVIDKKEMSAAMALHATTPYFHSDFAHTDYGSLPGSAPGSASWNSPPMTAPLTLPGSQTIRAKLWVGTNAVETELTATLSRWTEGGGWASLCGATGSTLYREGAGKALPLPGKAMVATSANGGFAVALPLEMKLPPGDVELQQGDILRLDVSCGSDSAAAASERVDQRVWHNNKWASTVEVEVVAPGAGMVELKFSEHPVISQPAVPAM